MSPLWFVRMARWVRNPPSTGRVKLVVAVVVIAFALVAVERFIGWPEALKVDRMRAKGP